MNKRVIMTGFHFPPSAVSSGHLRLLAFAKYLPEFGWDPVVLSATKGAYEHIDPGSVQSIPQECSVHRAFALDARRHFGLFGRYPSLLAQPDRWSNWWPGAVLLGLWLIKRYRAEAIWSTFPIMTSHCIAHTLSRLTGIPWIADFRDPVATAVAHKNPMTIRTQMKWERRVVSRASRSVFTTPAAMQWCAERYPAIRHRLAVIENGYDEAKFADLPRPPPARERPMVLLHSGLLYPQGRNPVPLFTAIANLKAAGRISPGDLQVVLRACGCESSYAQEIKRLDLDDIVTIAPPIPNRDALEEQAKADALLLLQGSEFNRQVPAKLYEYLRIGHPIFALVDPKGDTAGVLRRTGGAEFAPLDDADTIKERLLAFLAGVRDGRAARAPRDVVARYSRKEGAHALARLLQEVHA
jgi:glycosyltransferase involved in cell wall biosynthesis